MQLHNGLVSLQIGLVYISLYISQTCSVRKSAYNHSLSYVLLGLEHCCSYNRRAAAAATAATDAAENEAMLRAPLLQVLVDEAVIWVTSLLPAQKHNKHSQTNLSFVGLDWTTVQSCQLGT